MKDKKYFMNDPYKDILNTGCFYKKQEINSCIKKNLQNE